MNPLEQAELWHALRGGKLRALVREGDTLRFQIHHPQLAGSISEGQSTFLCAMEACSRFDLQPIRNDSTIISDLRAIERLALEIEGAHGEATGVVVLCKGQGGLNTASLRIRASAFNVWDEAFDAVTAASLRRLG